MEKKINSNTIKKIINKLKNKYKYYENIIICCCFKKSKILSYGISKPNIHLYNIQFSTHAEINAINNLKKRYKNINLLILRIKDNNLLLSKPCQFCIRTLNKFKYINKIYYSNNNNIYYDNIKKMYNNIHLYCISSGECRQLSNHH